MGGLVAQSASLAADQPRPSAIRMTTRLRELINRPGIVAAPGIYDPISARIAESLGFEALDLPAAHWVCLRCNGAKPLPGRHGRGYSAHYKCCEYPCCRGRWCGIRGACTHEAHCSPARECRSLRDTSRDQFYPKRFHYHMGQEHTIPAEEMLAKIRYAVEARRDPDFVIVGRTDAFRTVSFAEGFVDRTFFWTRAPT